MQAVAYLDPIYGVFVHEFIFKFESIRMPTVDKRRNMHVISNRSTYRLMEETLGTLS